jgi:hypothetical protein
VVLSDDQQFLAWRSIVPGADVAQAAIADIKTFNDGEAERSGTLDDTATHSKGQFAQSGICIYTPARRMKTRDAEALELHLASNQQLCLGVALF